MSLLFRNFCGSLAFMQYAMFIFGLLTYILFTFCLVFKFHQWFHCPKNIEKMNNIILNVVVLNTLVHVRHTPRLLAYPF